MIQNYVQMDMGSFKYIEKISNEMEKIEVFKCWVGKN